MCGIAGLISTGARRNQSEIGQTPLAPMASRMASVLSHRGPDGEGVWCDEEKGIALSHRRLAIVDLSQAGAQPMASPAGRYQLVYNGEIYNHLELRERLAASGIAFRGRSDTETLLAAIEVWGLNQTLHKIRGMYAFALWDKMAGKLHLVRDPFGKKPLYAGWAGSMIAFASELKSFHTLPDFPVRIDREGLSHYLQYGFVAPDSSIYHNVWQIPPGACLSIDPGAITPQTPLNTLTAPYFQIKRAISEARLQKIDVKSGFDAALNQFDALLRESVAERCQSDVPVGVFLSGGYDSAAVAALMQSIAPGKIKSFTAAFDDPAHDESGRARALAAHIGTEHHHIRVEMDAVRALLPALATIYDEPFANLSQIPTALLCQNARPHIGVALSGDGGDEMFGGYARHFSLPRLWGKVSWMPYPARALLGRGIGAIPKARLDRAAPHIPQFGRRLHRFAHIMQTRGGDGLYMSLLSTGLNLSRIAPSLPAAPSSLKGSEDDPRALSMGERIMMQDSMLYLPAEILTKIDRAAMAYGMEVRSPFLDRRIFDFAWRLPHEWKAGGTHHFAGKFILRHLIERYVPPTIAHAPKRGFGVPAATWLRGHLQDWAEPLLDRDRIVAQDIFCPDTLGTMWQDFKNGRDQHVEALWCVLMFQQWYEKWHG